MTSVGVTRESIVRELEAHEDDNYYLGTPTLAATPNLPTATRATTAAPWE